MTEAAPTRAALLREAGLAGAALAGWSSSSRNAHLANRALARGMAGGPTGFPGAARYQYGPESAEGRAIAGLRRLTRNGRSPITLTMLIWSGAIGHWDRP